MQPFVQLGLRMQQDGHRVRVSSHACFRDFVVDKGLEFFPLAGDPVQLSEFMVKTEGFIVPTTPELMWQVGR
jgi:sterol 3beta-glucosyltransferase